MMNRSTVLSHSFAVVAVLGWMGQCGRSSETGARARVADDLCGRRAIVVDSAFAVAQARRALEGFLPPVSSLVPSRVEFVREGVLITLVREHPQGTGGGGLVWVDGDNGCPIVLRR